MYRHNNDSFRKMWDEIGEATGTKWRVESELIVPDERAARERGAQHGEGMRSIRFSGFRE
jgi:hypothetical protein